MWIVFLQSKENYDKVELSFDHVLDCLLQLENKWWVNNQIDYKNVPSYEASRIKGRNIRRCLYLKIKRLITDFEKFLNKEPGLHFDIIRANHFSSTRPAILPERQNIVPYTTWCYIRPWMIQGRCQWMGRVSISPLSFSESKMLRTFKVLLILHPKSKYLPTQFLQYSTTP